MLNVKSTENFKVKKLSNFDLLWGGWGLCGKSSTDFYPQLCISLRERLLRNFASKLVGGLTSRRVPGKKVRKSL